MEGQAERVVCNVIALSAVEQVLLQVIADSEERTAGRIHGTVHAIRAKSTLDSGT